MFLSSSVHPGLPVGNSDDTGVQKISFFHSTIDTLFEFCLNLQWTLQSPSACISSSHYQTGKGLLHNRCIHGPAIRLVSLPIDPCHNHTPLLEGSAQQNTETGNSVLDNDIHNAYNLQLGALHTQYIRRGGALVLDKPIR